MLSYTLILWFVTGTPASVELCQATPSVTIPIVGPVDPSQVPQPQPSTITVPTIITRCDGNAPVGYGNVTIPPGYATTNFPDLASCQAASAAFLAPAAGARNVIRGTTCQKH